MKNNYLITIIFIVVAMTVSADLINRALAREITSTASIQYPLKELGDCKNGSDCKSYCDKPANVSACLDFAQQNNLMSDGEIAQAKKFMANGSEGPGGCSGKNACEQYCDNINHIDECISYAEKNNLMSSQELDEAKKVQSAIAKGVKPPACGNKKECDAYCEDPNNMEECITFGTEAGFIQGKELEDAQKMLAAIKKGVKPPPCKGKDACDQYCSNPDNIEICMNFAIESGMMNEQEKENSQKMIAAVKKGVKPPRCKGQKECDAYCSSDEHREECINFSIAAGMMSEKDAEMVRKTGGKGPGGCKGKGECDAFCNNPDNQETCFNFGRDNGMIPEEDLKNMENGKQQMKQTLEQVPAEVSDCLKTEIGADMVEKIKNGYMPQKDIGEKMRTCFEKGFNQKGPPSAGEAGAGGIIPPAGQAGPGGCKTPEECQKYCESNLDECKNFGSKEQQRESGTNPPNPNERDDNKRGPNKIESQIPQGQPCVGEDCQNGPPRKLQSGREIREGQEMKEGQKSRPPEQQRQQGERQMPQGQQSPPSSANPGAGGNIPPGEFVPLNQPTERQPQQPASNDAPPPLEINLKTDSFIGAFISAAFKFIGGH